MATTAEREADAAIRLRRDPVALADIGATWRRGYARGAAEAQAQGFWTDAPARDQADEEWLGLLEYDAAAGQVYYLLNNPPLAESAGYRRAMLDLETSKSDERKGSDD